MKTKTLKYLYIPILIVFSISWGGVSLISKYLGNNETLCIGLLAMTYIFFILMVEYSTLFVKYLLAITIIYLGLLSGVIGYSTLPENIYQRALDKYNKNQAGLELISTEKNTTKKQLQAQAQATLASQLEFKAAETRYFGEEEWFRDPINSYLLFLTCGLLSLTGILMTIEINRTEEKDTRDGSRSHEPQQ